MDSSLPLGGSGDAAEDQPTAHAGDPDWVLAFFRKRPDREPYRPSGTPSRPRTEDDGPEAFDLDDFPEAREAYERARSLGRRCTEESAISGLDKGEGSAERELARWKARVKVAGYDPPTLARLRMAIGMGEEVGRSEGDGERCERTVFPSP